MRSITLICSSHIVLFFLGAKQNTYLDTDIESPPTQSTPKSSSESLFFQEWNNWTAQIAYSFFPQGTTC